MPPSRKRDLDLRLGLIPDPSLWPAPYNELTEDAAWRFLTECWWTEDTAEPDPEKRVALVPHEEYLRRFVFRWVRAYRDRIPMVTEKSRRMVISWVCRGLETWALGLNVGSLLLIDQRHEDSAEHLWRIHFALEQLHENRRDLFPVPLHKSSPPHPDKKEVTHIILTNGSRLKQSHQEAGAQQGKGYSIVTMEELSKYPGASMFWGQAAFVTAGKAGGAGGWINAIANPNNNPSWEDVKHKISARKVLGLDEGWTGEPGADDMPGLAFALLPGGMQYCALHYSADPFKTVEWAREYRLKNNISARDWEREMELYGGSIAGEPVFPDFRESFHCWPEHQVIPLVPGSSYYGGWDAGQTQSPAFVLIQVTPRPWQVHVILEVCGYNEPMSKFAPRVQQALIKRHPTRWTDVKHFGDMTITTRDGTTGKTARQMAADLGFSITPVPNTLWPRIDAVTRLLLKEMDEGKPGFLVDTVMCPVLVEAFRGGYRFEPRSKRAALDPNPELKPEPEKNEWSHVADSLQYPCVKLVEILYGGASEKLTPSGRMGKPAAAASGKPGWRLG